MNFQYWNSEIEKMPRQDLEALQVKKLKAAVDQALKTPFYKERLTGAGIKSGDDIKTLSDLRKIPYTTKHDLRDGFPYGFLSIPKEEVVRLHASSGTTGAPTTIYFNAGDIKRWTGYVARCIYGTGCNKTDVFQNMITYGLFTGGLGFHQGGEEVGMLVIPSGSGNTTRQFRLMQDFGTTVVHATPSFLLHVESKMKEEGVSRDSIKLRKAFAGAEPYSEDTRRRIEELLKIDVYNSYGLSEMNGPGVAFECQCKSGLHLWEDGYIGEIIDPDTLEPLPDGQTGELVLTCLCREATPILRYRTRDLSSFYTDACACGRTHRRLRRITGRTDDMLIINGVNVFPSQIEEVVMAMKEVGNNYLIVLEKEGVLDRLIVKVEVGANVFMDDSRLLNALKEKIRKTLQAMITINPKVELHESGALPVSEGKAKRVQDNRPKDV
ncbi:phenylacetate--CoA ligase family protein [Leadbettera azotonutricia]|uniref:Phenylacetate-coenzyme A ligase n=1 Tax=Leadbettera azotonutricia (strain ATCC BAA-888 / DSM 13862 / ZAS-9) TaxID=545695 RepID=F5Y6W5_LEAAZ|nr:phenylacetate--CoA ligase [Leadbettera azotonutricia]AEF81427.1 phenylacetate-coenzyme A ligase (Phenylacetyl-CoAligase) (PA-CoA ligase) [Leadbettera azotonutricia ZAS-9]